MDTDSRPGNLPLHKDEKLSFYSLTNKDNLKNNNPECICVNEKGEVWIGTSGVGLFKYNPKEDKFEQYLDQSQTDVRWQIRQL